MPIILRKPEVGLTEGQVGIVTPGTGFSMPPGIEAIYEYNGVYLNNRSWVDKIRLTDIGGFELPEIRDSRENNPTAHGETPFNAFYSGRTIVLTGRIEAFTLEKLRDMQQGLRMAFSDLTEKPLIIRTGRPDRDAFIPCRTMSFVMSEAQRDTRFFRDFQITLRASNPRLLSYKRHMAEAAPVFYTNLLPNPSAETGDTTGWTARATNNDEGAFVAAEEGSDAVLETNLCTNPNAESDLTGHTGASASILSRSTADARYGSACIEATNTADLTGQAIVHDGSGGIAVTPGTALAARVSIKPVSSTLAGSAWNVVRLYVRFFDGPNGTGTIVETPSVMLINSAAEGQWHDLWGVVTVPANAQSCYLLVSATRDSVTNSDFTWRYGGALLSVADTVPDYFDGDTAPEGFRTRWTGTPNASTSELLGEVPETPWGDYVFKLTRDEDGDGPQSIWMAQEVADLSEGDALSLRFHSLAATVPRQCRSHIVWRDADSQQIDAQAAVAANSLDDWTPVTFENAVAPAGTAKATVSFRIDNVPEGESHYVDAAILVKHPHVPSYFDGDSDGADWNGSPHESTSSKMQHGEVVVFNRGGFEAQPILVLTGGMTNPVIHNRTTGQTISIDGEIPPGDVWTIDIEKSTMVDQDGNSVFGYLADDSEWIELAPRENTIQIEVDDLSGNPKLEVFWRHTWL